MASQSGIIKENGKRRCHKSRRRGKITKSLIARGKEDLGSYFE